MRKLIFILALCSIAGSSFAQRNQAVDPRLSGLDAELEKVLETWQAAGFAVAIVEKDKIIYSKGFGFRDYENRIPVTANTLFAIGSSSKAFTTAILGQLQSEKKLSFDDSPRQYIPELRFYNDEMNSLIKIRDIITHRTGLPRHDFSWYLFSSNSRDSLIQRIAYQEPFARVREKWYYNNYMYLTQGVIAERITGKSWEQNLQERFFDPLEMKRTNAIIDGLKKGEDAAYGYTLKNFSEIVKMDYYNIGAMGPAGSINSSVNEMSNWLMMWINGGKFKGQEILPSSYVREAMTGQMIISGAVPGMENPDVHINTYGFGWMISSYKGHFRVEHGGNIDGFSASVSFFPTDSIGIVVFANQNGSAVPGMARNIISDRMLKVRKTDWIASGQKQIEEAKKQQAKALESLSSSKKLGTKPSHLLIEYTGDYTHPGYGSMQLTLERDSLFAKIGLKNYWLMHYHYDVFVPMEKIRGKIDTAEVSPLRMNFRTNDVGDVSAMAVKLEPTTDEIVFKRTPKPIDIDEAELPSYVGEYELAGMTTRFYLKENSSVLYLFVPGQPEYELMPIGKHQFQLKASEGFKVEFLENTEGKIDAVNFIQPNGIFKAMKK